MTVAIVYGIEPTNWPQRPFMVAPRWPDGTLAIDICDPYQVETFSCKTLQEAHWKLNQLALEMDRCGHKYGIA